MQAIPRCRRRGAGGPARPFRSGKLFEGLSAVGPGASRLSARAVIRYDHILPGATEGGARHCEGAE